MPGTISSASRDDCSTVRLHLMRALYLLNCGLIGSSVWPQLFRPAQTLPLMEGVALSFYAALATLSLLGLRYPLKMVPLLFLQLFYKLTWLLAVVAPLSLGGGLTADLAGAIKPFVLGAILDLVVIPWPYVARNYLLVAGDRWKPVAPTASAGVPPNGRQRGAP